MNNQTVQWKLRRFLEDFINRIEKEVQNKQVDVLDFHQPMKFFKF